MDWAHFLLYKLKNRPQKARKKPRREEKTARKRGKREHSHAKEKQATKKFFPKKT